MIVEERQKGGDAVLKRQGNIAVEATREKRDDAEKKGAESQKSLPRRPYVDSK